MRNLAGGRMPPLTRTALLSGLAAFLLSLVVFKPVAPSHGRPPAAGTKAVLLSSDDPVALRAQLLDESLVFLPSSSAPLSPSGGYQVTPEGTPFSAFPPRLRFEPNRRPDLPFESNFSKFIAPLDAVNPTNGELLSTFSSTKVPLSSFKPRSLHCVITPAGFNQGGPITIEVGETPIFKPFKDGLYVFKAFVGVDYLGLLGKPTIITSSGDSKLDQAVLDWIGRQDWEGKLVPGLYQFWLGP